MKSENRYPLLRGIIKPLKKRDIVTQQREFEVSKIGVAGVSLDETSQFLKNVSHSCRKKYFAQGYHPPIVVDQPHYSSLPNRDWSTLENGLVDSIQRLSKQGAEFAVVPDNTAHHVINKVREDRRVTIPVISSMDALPKACVEQRLFNVGIIGTRESMVDMCYRHAYARAGVVASVPLPEEQRIIKDAISELVTDKKLSDKTFAKLMDVVKSFREDGCQGIVVECSKLSSILNTVSCGMPVLDSMSVLADAAVRESLEMRGTLNNSYRPVARARM